MAVMGRMLFEELRQNKRLFRIKMAGGFVICEKDAEKPLQKM